MPNPLAFAADLAAISALAALYFRRHNRPDMVPAFVALNVGVMSLTTVMSSANVGAGFGLGLFAVLSIIRLRSSEIDHVEVAYYFAALVLGLTCGLRTAPNWISAVLGALIVVVLALVDHPRLFLNDRRQTVTLDRAIAHEPELRDELATLLNADIRRVVVVHLDLVKDMTVVDVRYRTRDTLPNPAAAHAPDVAGNAVAGNGPSGSRRR